ncbi:ATP-dependent RNA helicase drs1-like [Cryptomeria japonica]|uniref:ATP-dependent RNA helicase drs1-like n=1 Tax=Cryptomeria japonica TaxID=3369 RepID=UPI0027DA460C|nr:ATP-dependent RNA helicase drs1-like [Cryptomeria japonica]
MERIKGNNPTITRLFKKNWKKGKINIGGRKVEIYEGMITEVTGMPMEGRKFYRDRKLIEAAIKRFSKEDSKIVKLVKSSKTYYSSKVIKKASYVQHSITELSDSKDEFEKSDDSEDEGSYMEWEDDFNRDTSAKVTRKGKDKDMDSGASKNTARKGFKRKRRKLEEEDSWLEEDDEDDDGMETESKSATPLPKKKTRQSPVITNIRLEKEDGTSKTHSTLVDPNK